MSENKFRLWDVRDKNFDNDLDICLSSQGKLFMTDKYQASYEVDDSMYLISFFRF